MPFCSVCFDTKWKGQSDLTLSVINFRTESNCPLARKHNNNATKDTNDADSAGVVLEELDENLGDGTSGTSGNGSKTSVRELGDTPKPIVKSTKKQRSIRVPKLHSATD